VGVTGSRDPRSDEELLGRVGDDADALEELYRRYVGKTVVFAIRHCATPEQVHDLVAATWIEVIAASSRYDPSRGRAVPWILGVMANLANNERRRRSREREALRRLAGRRVLGADDVTRLEEAIDASRLKGPLLREIEAMPARERQAIELVAFGEVGQEEAAKALGIAPATFRMRLARARRRLRAVADADDDVEVLAR